MANFVETTVSDTGFLVISTGNTAQRPASPANGMMRFNSETSLLEFYANGGWETSNTATANSGNVFTGSISYFIGFGGNAGYQNSQYYVTTGQSGSNTTATFQGVTIRANGGVGGEYQSQAMAAGGTFDGGDGGSNGGGSWNYFNTSGAYGVAGGGAVGGANSVQTIYRSDPGYNGGSWFARTGDTGNLNDALLSLNLLNGSQGAGGTSSDGEGGDSTLFGSGGGGASRGQTLGGSSGGGGGNGFRGGGGGGATGDQLTSYGGKGGDGMIVFEFTNVNTGLKTLDYVATYTGSNASYTIPTDTSVIKIWVIGGGGGGGSVPRTNMSSGGGGGGLAYKTWTA